MSEPAERIELPGSWYDYPDWYDISLQAETEFEIDFVEDIWKKHGTGDLKKILEPGCGTGRLVVEAARRGYQATGFDSSVAAIEYARNQLIRNNNSAHLYLDDMTSFKVEDEFDLAHCFCNTFRHLTDIRDARSHLESVADALRPGGLYLLGLHLFPIDGEPYDSERWEEIRDDVVVNTTFSVVRFDMERRLETIRVTLDADTPDGRFRVRSWMPLRIYSLEDARTLVGQIPTLEWVDSYDFVYDADDPIEVDEYTSDLVVVLRRR